MPSSANFNSLSVRTQKVESSSCPLIPEMRSISSSTPGVQVSQLGSRAEGQGFLFLRPQWMSRHLVIGKDTLPVTRRGDRGPKRDSPHSDEGCWPQPTFFLTVLPQSRLVRLEASPAPFPSVDMILKAWLGEGRAQEENGQHLLFALWGYR